jgi:predicted porin
MKKSLLALAVLTAISGAASAQSSVTLYGKVDLGMVYDAGGTAGKSLRVSSGVTGGSRIGFKGVEDLGGGLKASFQLETGFCADSAAPATVKNSDGSTATVPNFCTGSNNFMGRQAYGALSGAFGQLSAGRQYSLGFVTLTTIDPFGTGFAGRADNIFDQSGPRLNNSVQYTTPVLGGFSVSGEIALGEQQGNWEANRETGAQAAYATGPIYAAASWFQVNNAFGEDLDKVWNIGGTYDFGVVKIHGLVQGTKSADTLTTGTVHDALNLLGGVTVPLAGGSVMFDYIHHNDKEGTGLNDSQQWGTGYLYPLSKRTSMYVAYAWINNREKAAFTVGNATDTGTGNKAFNLGVVHNF